MFDFLFGQRKRIDKLITALNHLSVEKARTFIVFDYSESAVRMRRPFSDIFLS